MVLFMNGSAQWLLFVGMFVYTLGEVVTVLGYNPYASRRIPASHRGRIGGLSSVMQSIVQSVTQYSISFVLMAADGNYRLLWMSFIGFGIAIIALYALVYPWIGNGSQSCIAHNSAFVGADASACRRLCRRNPAAPLLDCPD